MEITYGHHVETDDDPYVELAEKVNQVLTDIGDTSLVDLFPIRKYDLLIQGNECLMRSAVKHIPEWFPGARFVRVAKGT